MSIEQKIADLLEESAKLKLMEEVVAEELTLEDYSVEGDLLNRFISKKGRPFKAFLVKTPGGKIGFEFQERVAKPGAVAKKGAAANEEKAEAPPLKKAAAKAKPASAATKTVKAKAKTPAKAPAKAKKKRAA